MKRYRVLRHDFDTRSSLLTLEIQETWEESIKAIHRENKERLTQDLVEEFGSLDADKKAKNFSDLGNSPFSIIAFHNTFLRQIRTAFVVGSYYPALTAACALGERILNHLILLLRDDFSKTPEYKRVYDKDSFDNWSQAIKTLEAWNILLPKAAKAFNALRELRTQAIHFNPEVDTNDRILALRAIRLLNEIVSEQFSGFGPQPWFITGIPGECYLKKEVELQPFIKRVYLPNCHLVGPLHALKFSSNGFIVVDNFAYESKDITDEEFVELRNSRTK